MSSTASSDFSIQLNISMGPLQEDGHRDVTIHGLRIQLPDPVPHTPPSRAPKVAPPAPLKQRPAVAEEKKEEVVYEYEEAPLKFSWAHPVDTIEKQKNLWHQLLWKSVLAQYPFESKKDWAEFQIDAFYASEFYTQRETQYSYCNMEDLMVLYMEYIGWNVNYYVMGLPDDVKRRLLLLTQFFLPHKIRWSPVYYTAYCEWAKNHGHNDVERFDSLNRHQRMSAFFQLFLNKPTHRR
jgi:hypothetical protein